MLTRRDALSVRDDGEDGERELQKVVVSLDDSVWMGILQRMLQMRQEEAMLRGGCVCE